jgi:hypothetical protein
MEDSPKVYEAEFDGEPYRRSIADKGSGAGRIAKAIPRIKERKKMK